MATDVISSKEHALQPTARRAESWLKSFHTRLEQARTLGLAAEMAFWLFLSLLPLAAVAGLVLAKLALGSDGEVSPLLASLPPASRELITGELTHVAAWNGGKVGLIAAVVFVWLASSGVGAVFDGLMLQTESTPPPWWKKRLMAIGACVGLSVGLAIITLVNTGLSWIWRLAGKALPAALSGAVQNQAGQLTKPLLSFALGVLMVFGLYWVALPAETKRQMPLLPGAAVAVLLQMGLGFGYSFYIGHAGNGGAYQAGLATIGVTMTALYLACLALLIGVELNQVLGERRAARDSSPSPQRAQRAQA